MSKIKNKPFVKQSQKVSSTQVVNPVQKGVLTIILQFFFYASVTMQWLWTAVVFLPAIIDSGFFDLLTSSSDQPVNPIEPVVPTPGVDILLVVFSVLVATFVIIGTLIFLARLPKAFATASEKAVEKTATKIVPVIVRHKKISKKKQQQLTDRTIYILQWCIIAVPLLLLVILGQWISSPIAFDIALTVATFLAIWPLFWLTLRRGIVAYISR